MITSMDLFVDDSCAWMPCQHPTAQHNQLFAMYRVQSYTMATQPFAGVPAWTWFYSWTNQLLISRYPHFAARLADFQDIAHILECDPDEGARFPNTCHGFWSGYPQHGVTGMASTAAPDFGQAQSHGYRDVTDRVWYGATSLLWKGDSQPKQRQILICKQDSFYGSMEPCQVRADCKYQS